jgi:hypothetical protein
MMHSFWMEWLSLMRLCCTKIPSDPFSMHESVQQRLGNCSWCFLALLLQCQQNVCAVNDVWMRLALSSRWNHTSNNLKYWLLDCVYFRWMNEHDNVCKVRAHKMRSNLIILTS